MTTARDCAPGGGARGSTTDPPGTATCAAHVAGGWEDPEGPPPNVGRTSVELRGGFGFVSAAAPPGGGSVAEGSPEGSPPPRSPRSRLSASATVMETGAEAPMEAATAADASNAASAPAGLV